MACIVHRVSPLAMALLGLSFVAGCGEDGLLAEHPVPATPDAAWVVNMSKGGPACPLLSSTRSLGELDGASIEEFVIDGQAVAGLGDASITCTVAATANAGEFSVNGRASAGPDALQISIPRMPSADAGDDPVFGSVAYVSDATAAVFQSTACTFFQAAQSVGAGKVWVTFVCAGVIDAATQSTCPIAESFAMFENCSTTGT